MLHEIHLTAFALQPHITGGWYSNGPTRYRTIEATGRRDEDDDPSLLELAITEPHIALSTPSRPHAFTTTVSRVCPNRAGAHLRALALPHLCVSQLSVRVSK